MMGAAIFKSRAEIALARVCKACPAGVFQLPSKALLVCCAFQRRNGLINQPVRYFGIAQQRSRDFPVSFTFDQLGPQIEARADARLAPRRCLVTPPLRTFLRGCIHSFRKLRKATSTVNLTSRRHSPETFLKNVVIAPILCPRQQRNFMRVEARAASHFRSLML